MTDLRLPAFVASSPMRSGLGNRLRFMLSCQAIAEAESREFYYYWPVGEYNGARFGAHLNELWYHNWATALDKPLTTESMRFFRNNEGDLAPVRNNGIIQVTGDRAIQGFGNEAYWGDLLADMEPTDAVTEIADKVAKNLDPGYISVQVRAHPTLTHKTTLEKSPVSWFINRMQEIRDQNPGAQFFLSSDTEEARAEIAARFPDIVSVTKTGEYNSREALIQSTADLVMLSRSSHILAPYYSTFAQLGWIMGNKAMPFEDSQRVIT